MARRCDRPGCSELAAIAFGFDPSRLLVWLDNLVDDDRAKAGALCQRHADRLTAPKGWWLDDRRVEVPELFHAEAPAPVPPPPTSVTRRTSRRRARKPAPEVVAPTVGEPAVPDEPGLPENLVPFSGFEEQPAPEVHEPRPAKDARPTSKAEHEATRPTRPASPPTLAPSRPSRPRRPTRSRRRCPRRARAARASRRRPCCPSTEPVGTTSPSIRSSSRARRSWPEPSAARPGPIGPITASAGPIGPTRPGEGGRTAAGRCEAGAVELTAELEAPCPPAELFAWVDDLSRYPAWLTIVTRAEAFRRLILGLVVDLRGRVGPFARSKRLRMVRTTLEPDAARRVRAAGARRPPALAVGAAGRGAAVPVPAAASTWTCTTAAALWGPVLERMLARRDRPEPGPPAGAGQRAHALKRPSRSLQAQRQAEALGRGARR